MAFLTFRGGIHPYDGKDLSKNCPVEKYLPKGDLAILFLSTSELRPSPS